MWTAIIQGGVSLALALVNWLTGRKSAPEPQDDLARVRAATEASKAAKGKGGDRDPNNLDAS